MLGSKNPRIQDAAVFIQQGLSYVIQVEKREGSLQAEQEKTHGNERLSLAGVTGIESVLFLYLAESP
ncbi:hypothetical protein ColLi_12272 [Colletotrichum liriopes]|uniref:Uncharacterized protein n=1 Tax=Colletotrichum liriopes TaxID=708192 RepID=A0AA37GYZ1_9PEZI|nr:hypothetical protein ColLi_12272 [Colletotrichum liriopes]